MKLIFLTFFILYCIPSWADRSPAVIIKKKNPATDFSYLEQPKPADEEPFLEIKIDQETKTKLLEYNKNSAKMNEEEKIQYMRSFNMNDSMERLITYNIEKQVLEKNLDRLKKSSPTIQNVSNTVEKAIQPNIEASSPLFTFGTKTDVLRRNSKIWLDNILFKTEAEMKFSSGVDYQIKVSRSLDLSFNQEISFLPVINTSLTYNDHQDLTSDINTKILDKVNLGYQHQYKQNVSSFSINYGFSF